MSNYSGESHFPVMVASYLVGFTLGGLIWGTSSYHRGFENGVEDETHNHDIQIQNEQISEELSKKFSGIGSLVLQNGSMNYTFDMRAVHETNETCTGSYEV